MMAKLLAMVPCSLLLALWLPYAAAYAEPENEAEEAEDSNNVKQHLSTGDTICGEPKIWHLITEDASVEGVQNIRWSEIQALAEEYQRSQEAIISQLKTTLELLKPRIEEALMRERVGTTSTQQLAGLITSATESFGGLKAAQDNGCGKPPRRPRSPRRAFDQSLELFKAAAGDLFNGKVRFDDDLFKSECENLLPHGEDSYCGRLCQRFRDEAQALSDASTSEPTGASAALMKEQQEAMEALVQAQAERSQCKQAQRSIKGFEAELDDIKQDMRDRFADIQKAEEALDDATHDLTELEDLLGSEEKALEEAVQALEEERINAGQAKASLEAVIKEEKAIAVTVTIADKSLAQVQRKLHAARQADKVIEELKAAVSVVAMKMQLFFEKAVLQPTRDLGLEESLDLEKHFYSNAKLRTSAGVMKDTVHALDKFCKVQAPPFFEAVKHKVDLTPLCEIGDPCDIKLELNKAVQETMRAEIKQIDRVRSWYDPFKGQEGMTRDKVEAFVSDGELRGLREFSQVYFKTKFSGYLRGWLLGGKHLALVGQLKDLIAVLESAFKELISQLAAVREKMEAARSLRKGAELILQEVLDTQRLAGERKAKLDQSVLEMQQRTTDMDKLLNDLEMQVWAAWQQYDGAKEKLLSTHQEGTSFLELLPSEEELSAALEAENSEREQEISLLKGRLLVARRALEDVTGRIASVSAGA